MSSRPLLLLTLIPLLLAGCTSGGTGTLAVHVTDAPDAIGDFTMLTVTVDKIMLHGKDKPSEESGDKDNETHKKTTYSPATATVDLVKLTGGNLTTIFKDDVPAGAYKKMTFYIRDAKGTLQNGTIVDVHAPSGRLFVNTDFTVEEGKETDFTFDIQVHQQGDGSYALKPNASGSGPGKVGTDATEKDAMKHK